MSQTPFERLFGALSNVRQSGDGFTACCPAHDDRNPSLSVHVGEDGRILVHCFAGCSPERVVEACGLTMRDLFPIGPEAARVDSSDAEEPATYLYRDELGNPLYRVTRSLQRSGRKRFHVEHLENEEWRNGLGSSPRVLYCLPELREAVRVGRRVYVVEGEKNAEDLVRRGLVATTAPFGAGKWAAGGDAFTLPLKGADVVVLADNDRPGRRHQADVLGSLYGVARSLRALDLPLQKEGDDVSDWLAAGGAVEELERLAVETPLWSPTKRLLERAKVVCAADVEPTKVSWLWEGRIPRGKITTVDGDPGLAKSTLLLDLAARLSVGGSLPDGAPLDGPYDVILLSAEDGVADTIVPRLKAAGADLFRIRLLTEVGTGDDLRLPELPVDIPILRELILERGAVLVIIDPLMAYLSAGIDAHRDQDVRRALNRLKSIAEETGAAIVVVRHCTKGVGTSAIHKGGGSVGIIGAARAGLLVAKDPEAPDSGRCIIAVAKSNVGPPVPALAYRAVSDEIHGCGRIEWQGVTNHLADDLAAGPINQEERGALAEARAFLEDYLLEGPKPAGEIIEAGKEAGISSTTLKRAKGVLRVRSFKRSAQWLWAAAASEEG
jgi:hypothetical protein